MSEIEDPSSKSPIKADYDKGKKLLESGDHAEAAVSLHNAYKGYEERRDKNGMANASFHLGHVCLARKDFQGAHDHYTRTWELIEELNDPLSLFALSKVFVDVYEGLEQYDKVLDGLFDLLEGYQTNNDPRGAVNVMERVAEIYEKMGEKEKAADTCRTIASVHRNFKHDSIAESFEKKADELSAAS